MGKILETTINRFDGGISEDKRADTRQSGNLVTNRYSFAKHFESFKYPKKLIPHYKTIARETKSYNIVAFEYAPNVPATGGYILYGLGVEDSKINVFKIDVDSGATTWTEPNNNKSAFNRTDEEVFFHYKNYIYTWVNNRLARFDTQGNDAFNDSYQSISFDDVAEPVYHPSDDIAYFFSDNKVHKLNDTSFTANALTLPDNLIIKCATAHGNYLAIGCVTKGTSDVKSIVFLWDRDSSLTTLSARINFGPGTIRHLASLNNKLIGIVDFYHGSTLSLQRPKILIKQASGDFGVTLNTITADEILTRQLTPTRVVEDNILYFPAAAKLDGDNRVGIWAVDSNGNFNLEFADDEITDVSGINSAIQGIYKSAASWWIAHSNDGSVNVSDPDLGFQESTYESLIIGDASKKYKLISAQVMTEPLAAGEQVTLKYRKDEESSYTTIFTEDTDDSLQHKAINIESSGANLPQFREIQFQIVSEGGAVITGLKVKYEEIDDNIA